MDDKDYSDDCSDAFRYLAQGLYNDMEKYDPEEEYVSVGLYKQFVSQAIEQEIEIQKILESLADSIFPNIGVDFARMEPEARSCSHEWKTYHGFTETFEFCQKCDVKK